MRPPLPFTPFFYNKVFISILRTRRLWFTFPFHLSRTLLLGLLPRCSHFLCMPFLSTSSISAFFPDFLCRCLLFIVGLLSDVAIFVSFEERCGYAKLSKNKYFYVFPFLIYPVVYLNLLATLKVCLTCILLFSVVAWFRPSILVFRPSCLVRRALSTIFRVFLCVFSIRALVCVPFKLHILSIVVLLFAYQSFVVSS